MRRQHFVSLYCDDYQFSISAWNSRCKIKKQINHFVRKKTIQEPLLRCRRQLTKCSFIAPWLTSPWQNETENKTKAYRKLPLISRGARFPKATKAFPTRKAIPKSQALRLHGCFIYIFLIRTDVSFIQHVSGCTSACFYQQINWKWLTGGLISGRLRYAVPEFSCSQKSKAFLWWN